MRLELDQEVIESIDADIFYNPLSLDENDIEVCKVCEFYIPYSTGIEIECFKSNDYKEEEFKTIKNIIDVNTCEEEQRYRIPKGIKGIKCLYKLSNLLYKYSLLDTRSGIHYHIDCTDVFSYINKEEVESYKNTILTRLDKWDYRGNYNRRDFSYGGGATWARVHRTYKTIEIRIGNQRFNYQFLLEHIIDANDIVRDFKNILYKKNYIENHGAAEMYAKSEEEIMNTLKNRIQ